MKWLVFAGFCSLASSQQHVVPRTYDLNGRSIEGVRTLAGGNSKSQVVENINGRDVPVETVEDRVVSEGPGGKIVERTIRRYDPQGRPGPAERQRIESRTEPDGSERIATTVLRADINGNMQVAERRIETAQKTGGTLRRTAAVEGPTANGTFETIERTEAETRELGAGKIAGTSTVSRLDTNGRFQAVARSTTERTETAGAVVENAAHYESVATGRMRLMRQTVSRTAGTRTEVDVFEPSVAGRAVENDAKPQLTRRQVVERTPSPAGMTETVTVQLAETGEPGRLGAARRVEQIVCTGECGQNPKK